MRVSREQLVRGVSEYVRSEILPKMDGNRAMQIILSIGVNAALANGKTVGAMLDNSVVKALLEDDGSGTYEIATVAEAMRTAIGEYGSFPVHIPPIPLVSPNEITLSLNESDIDAMRRRIEGMA